MNKEEVRQLLPLQFASHRQRMGFSQQLMAQFLGIQSLSSYVDYERRQGEDGNNKNSQPPFTKLVVFAQRMAVNLNWLADMAGAEMWSAELLRPLRTAVQKHTMITPAVHGYAQRISGLIRFTHHFNPDRYDALFLSGVCRRTRKEILWILSGADIGFEAPTPDSLAELLGLRTSWILTGQGSPFTAEYEHRLEAIHLLDEYEISNATIRRNIAALKELDQNERAIIG